MKKTAAARLPAVPKSRSSSVQTVGEYIAQFPLPVRKRLEAIRQTIRKSAPHATEIISYQMPTYKGRKNLVHFAGYARHVGFYPGSAAMARFDEAFASYVHAKGSVQFPHDRPLPLALVRKIVRWRVEEDGGSPLPAAHSRK